MVAELELAALSLHILLGVIVQVGPVLSVPLTSYCASRKVGTERPFGLIREKKRILLGDWFYLVSYFFFFFLR